MVNLSLLLSKLGFLVKQNRYSVERQLRRALRL